MPWSAEFFGVASPPHTDEGLAEEVDALGDGDVLGLAEPLADALGPTIAACTLGWPLTLGCSLSATAALAPASVIPVFPAPELAP
ncbi:hypothetical protein EFN09_00095 [Propionibacterium freudenreichii]|nr:hypothetical protein [Propionibacterium freudenreichii]MCT2993210.1 hypothetical protein [Propionibacterium freudenreichii]MCT2998266.1 hypothetical protein [Propionibacterium freudenreichii]